MAGTTYLAHKEKWNSPNFFLNQGPTRIALAVKPSWAARTFHLEHKGKQYRLGVEWKRFVLSCDGIHVGAIEKKSWLSRQVTANLPDELPLAINLFLIWLSLLMWKRDSDNAGGA